MSDSEISFESETLEQEIKEQETAPLTRKRSNSLSLNDQKKLLSEKDKKFTLKPNVEIGKQGS